MSDHPIERIRLPGLFRWAEVCDVFDSESGRNDEWHLEVRLTATGNAGEPLYTVYAWRSDEALRDRNRHSATHR